MDNWHPRSGFAKAGGYVWLPRLLDKVRHVLQHPGSEYYILESSPVDQAALSGWRVSGEQIRQWVAGGLSDEAIAQKIQETGGVSPEAFNRLFLLVWSGPMMVFEADEGRLGGPIAAVLKGFTPVFLGVRRVLITVGLTKEA